MTEISWAGDITGRLTRKYNSDFRITELAVNGSPTPFGYDADGLVIQAGALALMRNADHGLLTGTALGGLTDRYTYNGFGEVTDYGAEFNAAPLLTTAYTRDGLGRIVEKRETEGGITRTHAYAYDLAGRLVAMNENGAVIATYRYDENGNRTHVNDVEVAHFDIQDRLLDYQGTTYAYTPNGELASKTEGAFTTTYDYDVLGNLRSVDLPNGSRTEYLIDGQNRRIGKNLNGTLVQGFLYQDQLKPIAELDGNNQVVSRFVYAGKANVPAYLVKNGITYRILSDHLGSPRLIVKADAGEIVQRMNYEEWGRVILDTNPGFQPFGFAGGLYDRDTKLVRFGARDYDPDTGRWTAKDPIRFAGGDANLFGYTANDPINFIDSTGLAVGDWWDFPANLERARQIAREEIAKRPISQNDMGDAMRHAEWMRRTTQETNSCTARIAGTGHELDNLLHGQPFNEILMDLHNNAVGRDAGRNSTPVDLGKLWTLPLSGSPYNPYQGVH